MSDQELVAEMCTCGHQGGFSKNGEHVSVFQQGHGACRNVDCDCKQFTWTGWCKQDGTMMTDKESSIALEELKKQRGY